MTHLPKSETNVYRANGVSEPRNWLEERFFEVLEQYGGSMIEMRSEKAVELKTDDLVIGIAVTGANEARVIVISRMEAIKLLGDQGQENTVRKLSSSASTPEVVWVMMMAPTESGFDVVSTRVAVLNLHKGGQA